MWARSVFASLLLPWPATALEIEIRYDYDSAGFFNQPGAREAIEAVADFYEQRIHDSLAEINPFTHPGAVYWNPSFFDPSTGAFTTINDLVVPEDTLIVFAGARNLGGATGVGGPGSFASALGTNAWYDLIRYRGQAGASDTPASDFGPWGGSISFDNSWATTWSFQLDGRPNGFQSDFVSSALHELGHVLGIGTADSWKDRVVSGSFTGSHAVNSFGAVIPVDSRAGHWKDNGCAIPGPFAADSLTHGSFDTDHGADQVALMDPARCISSSDSSLDVMTDLDLAALVDIGWELIPPQRLDPAGVGPATASFSWPSVTWLNYQVSRGEDLSTWFTIYGPTAGTGEDADWQDPAPPAKEAYYRLLSEIIPSPAPPAPPPAQPRAPAGSPLLNSIPPRIVTDCGRHAD